MKKGSIGEFALIEKVRAVFNENSNNVVVGIGDDAAAVKGKEKLTLITSDMLVEGVHFDLAFTSPDDLGKKSVAVNISDIAAMGGRPTFFLFSLGIPEKIDSTFMEDFYAGAFQISREYDVRLIGGDTVASNDRLVIGVSLMGEVREEDMLRRSGAKPGDLIFVTGTVGDSAAGLELLKSGVFSKESGKEYDHVLKRHLTPAPRVAEACRIAENHLATAMIDVSDGLMIDLKHICDESGVRGIVQLEDVPISDSYKYVAKRLAMSAETCLAGGEDYELIFTAPVDKRKDVAVLAREFSCGITCIGRVVEGFGVAVYDKNNRPIDLASLGYEHSV